MNRLPRWFRQEIPDQASLDMMRLFSEFAVNTVCQEAKCPNITYCFQKRNITFMILGDTCTRNCRFCNVGRKKGETSASTSEPSLEEEPEKVAQIVKLLGLKYVVITSVTRDDLPDGGASVFAKIIQLIRKINKDVQVEVLIPDFQAKLSSIRCVIDANPCVVGHNIETVPRLYSYLRPLADYQRSLYILSKIKELRPKICTKSSLMLGLGETEAEVIDVMKDLRTSLSDILTLGQYLAPSLEHYPVEGFVTIEQFNKYKEIGLSLGFKSVVSGPLVRSSYNAEELKEELDTCTI